MHSWRSAAHHQGGGCTHKDTWKTWRSCRRSNSPLCALSAAMMRFHSSRVQLCTACVEVSPASHGAGAASSCARRLRSPGLGVPRVPSQARAAVTGWPARRACPGAELAGTPARGTQATAWRTRRAELEGRAATCQHTQEGRAATESGTQPQHTSMCRSCDTPPRSCITGPSRRPSAHRRRRATTAE